MDSLAGLASRVRTADIVDAMGRLHQHRCHLLDLVSPTPGRRLFGPAVTISYFPTCGAALPPERYNFKRLFYQAIEGGADGHLPPMPNGEPWRYWQACLADRQLVLYQPAYSVTGFAQVRMVSEAMRSGDRMSLFQACWQASRMAS